MALRVAARQHGFTLLEMAVAFGIFAVLAAISYGSLTRFLETRDELTQRHAALRQLQLVFDSLGRDIRYMAVRSVRNGFGDVEQTLVAKPDAPLEAGELLRLTTAQPLSGSAASQRLTRVAWRLDEGDLSRIVWRVLDRDEDSAEQSRLMLQDVTEVSLLFFSLDSETQLQTTPEWDSLQALPRAIEISITRSDARQYRRLFEVTDGV